MTDEALSSIAAAAEESGVGEQTLRLYERRGLIEPARTAGGTRKYSRADMIRVRRVIALVGEGINLAGVARVLELEAIIVDLERDAAASTRRTRHDGQRTGPSANDARSGPAAG